MIATPELRNFETCSKPAAPPARMCMLNLLGKQDPLKNASDPNFDRTVR